MAIFNKVFKSATTIARKHIFPAMKTDLMAVKYLAQGVGTGTVGGMTLGAMNMGKGATFRSATRTAGEFFKNTMQTNIGTLKIGYAMAGRNPRATAARLTGVAGIGMWGLSGSNNNKVR